MPKTKKYTYYHYVFNIIIIEVDMTDMANKLKGPIVERDSSNFTVNLHFLCHP